MERIPSRAFSFWNYKKRVMRLLAFGVIRDIKEATSDALREPANPLWRVLDFWAKINLNLEDVFAIRGIFME